MQFGRIESTHKLDRITFRLPPDSIKPFERSQMSARFYFGGPMWGNPQWVGKVYPPNARSQDFLKYYAKQFPAIELNSTFYGVPQESTVLKWKDQVGPHFRFCPKFPKMVSHALSSPHAQTWAWQFAQTMKLLKENLGTSFLQLPETFGPTHIKELEKLLNRLPKGFKTAVEFRHPGWFHENKLHTFASELLTEHDSAAVITDVAGRRDVLHMDFTTRRTFVRFTGNNLHPSDFRRIDLWVKRLGSWAEQGTEEIYFFIHEPDDRFAPDLIKYFVNRMNAETDLTLKAWVPLTREEDTRTGQLKLI